MKAYAPVWIVSAAALLLLTACAGSGGGGSTATEPSTTNEAPLAAYAVVSLDPEPNAGVYLVAVDPHTLEISEERQPIELGRGGQRALSPDGGTMALGWAPTGGAGVDPQRLVLIDLASWTRRDLDFEALISRIFWSADGARLYVAINQLCFVQCVESGELVTIEPDSGQVIARVDLPGAAQSALSPDGTTLYIFGRERSDPQVEPQVLAARLTAFDIERGVVTAELELSDIRFGQLVGRDGDGTDFVNYEHKGVMSPDGSLYYIAHANEDRITVIDLKEMTVRRSGEIREPSSLAERVLDYLAGSAHAIGPITGRGISISPDGRRLYITGWEEGPTVESGEGWEFESHGLKVVDAESFEILAEAPPFETEAAIPRHEWMVPGPAGRYLYAGRDTKWRVLDPNTLEVLAEAPGPLSSLIVGLAPPRAAAPD